MAKAELVWRGYAELLDDAFVEGVVRRVPAPVLGSTHSYNGTYAFSASITSAAKATTST